MHEFGCAANMRHGDDAAEARRSELAAGRAHTTEHHWGDWVVRVRRAPILKNSEYTTSEYSAGAWKRDLSLTLHAGQHLPGALFGGNSLELFHEASGTRLSFCALEALRCWALLDLEPVQHLSPQWRAAGVHQMTLKLPSKFF